MLKILIVFQLFRDSTQVPLSCFTLHSCALCVNLVRIWSCLAVLLTNLKGHTLVVFLCQRPKHLNAILQLIGGMMVQPFEHWSEALTVSEKNTAHTVASFGALLTYRKSDMFSRNKVEHLLDHIPRIEFDYLVIRAVVFGIPLPRLTRPKPR